MDFKIAEIIGLVIASIEGQIRFSTQDDFREHLDSLCDSKGTQTVLLDMEKVSYMNSGGIGIIIDTFKKFRDKGGQLILCGLIPDIMRLFEVTKLIRLIKFYSCAEDALLTLKCA